MGACARRLHAPRRMLRRVMLLLLGLAALLLVAGGIATSHLAGRAEARHPPAGDFLSVTGSRLHYTDEGSGPAVVLLHGAGANLLDFQSSLAPRLSERFRVICVDRPGSGYSTTPEDRWLTPVDQARAVLELLDELSIDTAVWAGHSWGGSVVMAALLEAPGRVAGGVLLAGAAYPWTGGVDFTDRLPDVPVLGPLLTRTLITPLGHLLLRSGIDAVFAPNAPTAGYVERTGVSLYLRPSQFTATGRDIARLSPFLVAQAERYATISQPLLLVHGEDDTIVPAWNHTDRLERLLPTTTETLRLAATGHAPHHTHPEQIALRMAGFVGRVLGGAAEIPEAVSSD